MKNNLINKLLYNSLKGWIYIGSKIIGDYKCPHSINIRPVILALGLYLPAIITQCNKKNVQTSQLNQEKVYTKEEINKNIKNDKTYILSQDTIDKILNENITIQKSYFQSKNNIPKYFNIKENKFKLDSIETVNEY